jgi:hypothetical protein
MPSIDPTELPLRARPPIVLIHQPYASGYVINPNQAVCFPVVVGWHQRILFNVIQTSKERQDYTLSCWFSTAPNDPVLYYPNREYCFHLLKNKATQYALQDGSFKTPHCVQPSVRLLYVPSVLPAGTEYYFNIKNSTGYPNKFEFQYTVTDLK